MGISAIGLGNALTQRRGIGVKAKAKAKARPDLERDLELHGDGEANRKAKDLGKMEAKEEARMVKGKDTHQLVGLVGRQGTGQISVGGLGRCPGVKRSGFHRWSQRMRKRSTVWK